MQLRRIGEALGLLERSITDTQSAAAVLPPSRSILTTVDQALTIDAVYRAFFVLEAGAVQLTLDVWRTLAGTTRRLSADELPSWVSRPNVDETGSAFYAATITSLAARGNAYWLITRGADGSIVNVDVLDPLLVQPEREPGRRSVRYHFDGTPYTRERVRHLALVRLPGKLEGLGPIQAAQRQLAGALAQRAYADQWFTDPGHVDAVLKTDQHLTAQQAADYKRQWRETQGVNNGPAVLGAGLAYTPLHLKPEEVQWLEAQKFGVTGIARLFGIPSSYMLAPVEGASLTYKNQEQEDISFVRFTLMRYLREIELAVSGLLPRTQVARWNVDALLRTDTHTRYQAHEIGLRSGFLTLPEVRAIEGLDPLPEGAALPTVPTIEA